MIGILAAVVFVVLFLLVTLFVGLIFEALTEEELEDKDASEEDDNKKVTLNVYGNDGSCYFSGRFKSKKEALEQFDQIRKSTPVSLFTIEYCYE